jgi:hypothetical protein
MGLTSIFLIQLPFVCSSHIFHYYDRWVVDANHFAGSTRFADQKLIIASLNVLMLFRTEALTLASHYALWPSFRPFCHPIWHTGARYTPEQKHGHLFSDASCTET